MYEIKIPGLSGVPNWVHVILEAFAKHSWIPGAFFLHHIHSRILKMHQNLTTYRNHSDSWSVLPKDYTYIYFPSPNIWIPEFLTSREAQRKKLDFASREARRKFWDFTDKEDSKKLRK